jgi:hypothetical protein
MADKHHSKDSISSALIGNFRSPLLNFGDLMRTSVYNVTYGMEACINESITCSYRDSNHLILIEIITNNFYSCFTVKKCHKTAWTKISAYFKI